MNSIDITLLSLGCTLLGVLITKVWSAATERTTIHADINKAKGDVNAVGIKLGRAIAMLGHSSWADTPEKQDQLSRLNEPKW